MDERTRRVGENEALFRIVNEEAADLQRALAEIGDDSFEIVCECGDLLCQERLTVAVSKYEQVRADPALFFVVPGHDKPSTEEIVEAGEAYNIAQKHRGEPERLARATHPRQ